MVRPGPRQEETVEKFLDPSQARRLVQAFARLPHPEGSDGERLPKEYYAGFDRMRREAIDLVKTAGMVVDLDEEE